MALSYVDDVETNRLTEAKILAKLSDWLKHLKGILDCPDFEGVVVLELHLDVANGSNARGSGSGRGLQARHRKATATWGLPRCGSTALSTMGGKSVMRGDATDADARARVSPQPETRADDCGFGRMGQIETAAYCELTSSELRL